MKRVAAKFVPRLLSIYQEEHRLKVCSEFKNRVFDDYNVIKGIIKCAETLVMTVKPKFSFQKGKRIFFFEDIIHFKFVPQRYRVNQPLYKEVLILLREKVQTISVIPHTSSSLDLAPCDILCFLNYRLHLKYTDFEM